MDIAIEITGVVLGLIYLLLEIKKKNAMWIFGVAMAVMYIIIFWNADLYAAMGLQVYYLVVSIYGWLQWRRDATAIKSGDSSVSEDAGLVVLRSLKWQEVLISTVLASILYFVFAFLLSSYTGDPQPQLDSIVTALSFLGTYWLSRSFIWQWVVWIAANSIAVGLYLAQGLYPTAGLYFIYIAGAIYGLIYWKRQGVKMAQQNPAK